MNNKSRKDKKGKTGYYQLLAEQWFNEHYEKLGLWQIIKMWFFGIDSRMSALSMFGEYLDKLNEK
jgi:hypothetical protein